MGKMSFKPSEAVEGGGLLNDVVVTISNARTLMFDYGGKSPVAAPAIALDMTIEGEEPVAQYFSMGSPDNWQATEDGKGFQAVGTAVAPTKTAKGMLFLASLVDNGFPEDDLDSDNISCLNGTVAHVIQAPAPTYAGLQQKEGDRPRTILLVDEVVSLPSEAKTSKKGKSKKGGKGKDKSSKLKKLATKTILAILSEEDEVQAKLLPKFILEKLEDDDRKAQVVNIAFESDFLENGPWDFDDGVLTEKEDEDDD